MSRRASDGGEPRKRGRKVRVDLRRNIGKVARRKREWTRGYQEQRDEGFIDHQAGETVRAKGSLSRRRTVIEDAPPGDQATWRDGVVVAVRGLMVEVDEASGARRRCVIRRMLRSRLIAERSPIAVGDRVRFDASAVRTADEVARELEPEGVIEEVLPRRTTLMRQYEDRVHVIAANVDQAIIVTAVSDPPLRPHLIDRFLVAAHKGDLRPVIVINKIDTPVEEHVGQLVLDVVKRYRALGYTALLMSAATGEGIDELRAEMKDRSSVIVGTSGVGKSSLLNAVQPGLKLRVGELSESSGRGQHTTTTAELLRLEIGGYVVDTPGIRQFELAHVEASELEAYFAEFHQRVAACRFPGCRHLDEEGCAIRAAAEAGEIHPERYASYVRMMTQRLEEKRS